ncbi:MAG: integration host factor subunit beta [Holosporaceae bacterium]|nr:integration host factor subunit beta [Holosporaceae bacterium]
MTKLDLITKVSAIYPYMSIHNVEKIISIILNSIVNTLKNGGRVELRGFGVFTIRERDKTEGRNPRTGEKVAINAKKVPFFKAGKQLKDLINGNIPYGENSKS